MGEVDGVIGSSVTMTQSTPSRWWIVIVLRAAVLPVLILSVSTPYLLRRTIPFGHWLAGVLIVITWTIVLLSPIAVYFDRKYISSVSEWVSTGLYYLMIIPVYGIGTVLALHYLYSRHKYVGTP